MARIADLLVLKNGDAINGRVDVPVFHLKTRYGALDFPRQEIWHIHYRKPPNRLEDAVRTSAAGEYTGDLSPDVIPVFLEEAGQTIRIPKADILTIEFFHVEREPVSTQTAKALEAVRKRP